MARAAVGGLVSVQKPTEAQPPAAAPPHPVSLVGRWKVVPLPQI